MARRGGGCARRVMRGAAAAPVLLRPSSRAVCCSDSVWTLASLFVRCLATVCAVRYRPIRVLCCDLTMAFSVFCGFLVLLYGVSGSPISMVGTGYEGITVSIDPTVPAENCGIILANFEVCFCFTLVFKYIFSVHICVIHIYLCANRDIITL